MMMKIINISELYLMGESVDSVKKMFGKIVQLYIDTERPIIIITGHVARAMDGKESEQVEEAVKILEKHNFGFIRITSPFI
ncbi:hypothetical protein VU04_07565 [Desulfobulbus sp. TB]|nr:hypothetical protein [Desulfobulbus sp. TB]